MSLIKNSTYLIKGMFGKKRFNNNTMDDKKKYDNFFFRSIRQLSNLLIGAGLIGAIIIYLESGNMYNSIAMVLTVVWVSVFLRYFLWSVYHYNVNYGYTENELQNIKEANERKSLGMDVPEEMLKTRDRSPYFSQTFGLPPGTVRGMIAFTLLFGSLTILIVSMGYDENTTSNPLLVNQFEFFTTAFLMMIAFYFGDKSLKSLRRISSDSNTNPSNTKNQNDVEIENSERDIEEAQFASTNLAKDDITNVKTQLNNGFLSSTLSSPKEDLLKKDFIQIDDSNHQKVINDNALEEVIEKLLEEDGIVVQLPVLKSIIQVESRGRGHLENGKAKILFEGHKFWYWLKELGHDPNDYVKGNEDILYPRWTKNHYKGKMGEYTRFDKAMKINEEAAIYSASWGLFQILGENIRHNIKNRMMSATNKGDDYYEDIYDFVEKQHESEYFHLLDFVEFIKTKKVNGKPLISYISGYDASQFNWGKFAYGYNGAGYQENKYDQKLKKYYEMFSNSPSSPKTTSTLKRIPIIDAGHGGMVNGEYSTGQKKRYKFTGADQDEFEILEGVTNRAIAKKLAEKLDKAGIKYYNMNMNDENDLSLSDRVKKANDFYLKDKSSYLLSIHSNSASKDLEGKGTTAHGFEIYTSKGKTISDELAEKAAKIYKTSFPNRRFRTDTSDGDLDKEADYTVLKKTKCPAILVENLFFDNYDEAKYLLSEKGQDEIATCLLNVVKEIYNS